jgi:peptide/nickel transport system ATP-binding protein
MHVDTPVLELDHVCVCYDTPRGPVEAVHDVSLTIPPNTIVGLIGESGSGKSTLATAIMRLMKENQYLSGGSIRVLGKDVYAMSRKELRQFRWKHMSMVFQSAMSALNPVMTVEDQIIDMLLSHETISMREARDRARELLQFVGIDAKHLRSYPHELSGGMRQRIVIAIAIALQPQLVIMDEPTTALDVVVQKSILEQIQEIQAKQGFSVLFISHDFSLVAEIAQRVAIMYAGRIVEDAPAAELLQAGRHHPYTEGLIRAIPKLTEDEVTIEGIPGYPPDLANLPSGCPYHPRCPHVMDVCRSVVPLLRKVENGEIACHLFK